jgi:hypothetical protein
MTVAGLWLLDQTILTPWFEEWDRVSVEIIEKRDALESAEHLLKREVEAARDWRIIENQLTAEDRAATTDTLLVHMENLEQRAGVTMDITSDREVDRGDFSEINLEISLQTDISGLRNLLVELYNSEEFLRMSRLNVSAQPFDKKRKGRLDVGLRVSTIEYHPIRKGVVVPVFGDLNPPVREVKKKDDYKVIVDQNIFSPYRAKKEQKEKPKKEKKKDKPKPKASWVITSLYHHAKSGEYRFIVEKSDGSEPLQVLKKDDTFEGFQVISVEGENVELKKGEDTEKLKVGDKLPSPVSDAGEGEEGEQKEPETAEETTEEDSDRLKAIRDRLKKKYKKKPLPEPPEDE